TLGPVPGVPISADWFPPVLALCADRLHPVANSPDQIGPTDAGVVSQALRDHHRYCPITPPDNVSKTALSESMLILAVSRANRTELGVSRCMISPCGGGHG